MPRFSVTNQPPPSNNFHLHGGKGLQNIWNHANRCQFKVELRSRSQPLQHDHIVRQWKQNIIRSSVDACQWPYFRIKKSLLGRPKYFFSLFSPYHRPRSPLDCINYLQCHQSQKRYVQLEELISRLPQWINLSGFIIFP